MTIGALTHHPRWRRRRAHVQGTRLAGVGARLRSRSLDRDLGSGVAPWRSRAHAVRYRQLTSRRHRHDLAKSLQRLLVDAHRPIADYRLTAAVPPCRTSVLAAAPQIQDLIVMLRADVPVRAEGIIRLRALLSDGAGPVYTRGRSEQVLAGTLDRIADCLRAQE
jgi:hypothetical protein